MTNNEQSTADANSAWGWMVALICLFLTDVCFAVPLLSLIACLVFAAWLPGFLIRRIRRSALKTPAIKNSDQDEPLMGIELGARKGRALEAVWVIGLVVCALHFLFAVSQSLG